MDLVLQTGNKGSVIKTEFDPLEKFVLSIDTEGFLVVWDLKQRKQYTMIYFGGQLNDAGFLSENLIGVAFDKSVEIWDFTNNTKIRSISFDAECTQIVKSGKSDKFYIKAGELFEASFRDKSAPKKVDELTNVKQLYLSDLKKTIIAVKPNSIELFNQDLDSKIASIPQQCEYAFYNDSTNTLAISTSGAVVKSYKLVKGQFVKQSVFSNNRKGKKYKGVALSKSKGVIGNQNDVITFFEYATGKILKNVKNRDFGIFSVSISPSQRYSVVGGASGTLKLYDLEDYSHIHTLRGVSANITYIEFLADSSSVLLGYDNGNLKKWNFNTHKVQTLRIESSNIDRVRQANYTILKDDDKQLVLKKYLGGISGRSVKYRAYALNFDFSDDQLAIEKVKLPEAQLNTFVRKLSNFAEPKDLLNVEKGARITAQQVAPDGNYKLVATSNGMLHWVDAATGQTILKLFSPGDQTFFYVTPDHYYFASKTALQAVGVRYKSNLLGFEQIDLLYNRPDKVLARLGNTDSTQLGFLESAYYKRLKKMNIDPQQVDKLDNLPSLSTNLSDLQVKTEVKKFDLQIQAQTPSGQLKSIHVLINGVPIYGRKGFELTSDMKSTKLSKTIPLQLSNGNNHIQIYVENSYGLKSIREDANVFLKESYDPLLYVLTIGSGEFTDTLFNLKYAGKDAEDVSKIMLEGKVYKNVSVKSLIGKDVHKKGVISAVKWLEKAKPDDVVMVFFAGHGVLDSKFDYFLSTSDIDFTNPEEKGLSYNYFENLIGALPCRNKVLLIDACHSGELDKEEIMVDNREEVVQEDVVFRKVGASISHFGTSTFEITKNIFTDLRQNSGVVVISSAGGAEFAMEGQQWSNGVFTYSLIKGLTSKDADLNGNHEITLSEIQKYLFETVPKLTNGRQTPTSRVEILEQDFRIW